MQKIQNTTLDELDIMVSFDVVSLFTKVPVDEAMGAIEEMLEKDESINERMTMSPYEVCRLTLYLRTTYFTLKMSSLSNVICYGSPLVCDCQPLLLPTAIRNYRNG